MSGNAFIGDDFLLDISLDAASARLERLTGDGLLLGASEYAYGQGIACLAEEAGPTAGLSWLARIQPGHLAETPHCARLPLRWEAIGPDGAMFPALDADLTLSPVGESTTMLTLAGVYRLPGQAAAGLDPAIVRCCAAVTIRCLVARLACVLMHPAGSAVLVRHTGQDSVRCPSGRQPPSPTRARGKKWEIRRADRGGLQQLRVRAELSSSYLRPGWPGPLAGARLCADSSSC